MHRLYFIPGAEFSIFEITLSGDLSSPIFIALCTDMSRWLPVSSSCQHHLSPLLRSFLPSFSPPSLFLSQGQWHAPVEPSPQLPWQLLSHGAGYYSLSQWWHDKWYNYVNLVQPKCFCRLPITVCTALSLMLFEIESSYILSLAVHPALLHYCTLPILCSSSLSVFHTNI